MTAPEAIFKYVNIVFAVTYIFAGIGVLWKHTELNAVLNGYSYPFGIVLILYGLFRGYRLFQKYS